MMQSDVETDVLNRAKAATLEIIDKQMENIGERFPLGWTENGKYAIVGCENWMSGFWSGMLWLAYEWTGKAKYRSLAEKHIDIFMKRIETKSYVGNHDLGFLYSLSCVSAYRLTGNERAKKAALMAADHLYDNFFIDKGAPHINAWAEKKELVQDNSFMIIDCLMNLPLLYWASEVSGDEKYRKAALAHTETTSNLIFREDGSTYHKYNFDVETGMPRNGSTAQGYSDQSCWSRGQAWGVYGFALAYAQTKQVKYLNCFKRAADYFISKLPEDTIPYWDFTFTDGDEPRDSSAAVIAACGILEAAGLVSNDEKIDFYLEICEKMTKSLLDKYAIAPESGIDGLISGGTAFKAQGQYDQALIFGDYFYMELLTRLTTDWKKYW